ncbi:SUZ domain-containing protein 1 [Elysia marginata]|uniref:SUZ RNA-binding domain-containing n=1 Tax=Elysia marginata TaxID=1093978 RepID=A0AAV4GDV1_9GAST|nr:SUZ domain-containing protein 1 [Elysia marginata]
MADDEADILDNWEEQADSGVLDKRLEEMALDVTNNREKKKQVISVAKRMVEEGGPTPYQPQVRILKRDTTAATSPQQNTGVTSPSGQGSSKHSKSLQQREAEYAQARLRIFGSLPPPDDEEEVGNSTASGSIPGQKTSDATSSILSDGAPQIVKLDPSQPHVTILRQPRCPDGTSGFKRPDHT